MKRPLFLVTLAASSMARVAFADHCDSIGPSTATTSASLTAALRLESARYTQARFEGSWFGMRPELALARGRLQAGAAIGLYRLERNGAVSTGPGDLALETRYDAIGEPAGARFMGLALGATLPTGDAGASLGMGHVMLMPALVGSASGGDAFAFGGRVGANFAVGAHTGHTHGSSAGPIVDPMNQRELVAAAHALWRPHERLFMLASALGAAPLGDGRGRAFGGLGAGVRAGTFEAGAMMQAPVWGDAFDLRGLLTLAFGV